MHDSTLETRLAELESRLAFQEITIEDLNKTVTAHEIEMAKMREHMRLMIEKLKATQPSHIASQGGRNATAALLRRKKAGFPAFCRLRAEAQRLVAAAATVAAAAAFTMVVTMIVAVAAAATVMTMVMIVIVAMRAVHVTVLQLFRSRFADGDDFHIKLQVLASQHVVAINHNVVVFNFSNFYWYRTLIGFRREAHANLQFINAHEDVFRYTLHRVFVILTVSVVSADGNVKLSPTSWPSSAFSEGRKSGSRDRAGNPAARLPETHQPTHRLLYVPDRPGLTTRGLLLLS